MNVLKNTELHTLNLMVCELSQKAFHKANAENRYIQTIMEGKEDAEMKLFYSNC